MAEQSIPTYLGTDSIPKLLTRYSIPAIIAMTAASMYNMVDSIFIGRGVGPLGISGLALTLPLMNMAAAFGSLVGIGASTLLSVKMGQKDTESAERIIGNVILLNSIIGALFSVIGLLFLDKILYIFGASDQTLPYARDYMQVILMGNVMTHIYLGLNDMLRASGYPARAMIATLSAVLINCLLNALFIFSLGWGIRGAAWATLAAQAVALTYEIIHFSNPKHYIHFKRGIFRLRKQIVQGILAIGLSPFLMNLCASVVVILINRALQLTGGDMAVGAYGIVNRVALLFVMIVFGFNQGMQPIAGYNFGAQKYDRVIKVLKYTIICGVSVTTTGFLLCELMPRQIAFLFTDNEELIGLAARALRIVLLLFPLVGFQIVTSNFFQSIGMAKKAIFLSLTRQMLFLIPFLLILPRIYGDTGVWMSMPLADTAAIVVASVMLTRQLRKFRSHMQSDTNNATNQSSDNR